MKKTLILSFLMISCFGAFSQRDKAKSKVKSPKQEQEQQSNPAKKGHEAIWEATKDTDGKGPKPSKNQPAKVRAAFSRDYPNASQVSWGKYRGDWTATFVNGGLTSTAVYHANGDRKDTRTVIQKPQMPSVILDNILKKKPGIQLGDIVKIELPGALGQLFRVKTIAAGSSSFAFYDAGGKEIRYDY